MELLWNDRSAIRGYHLQGMTEEQICLYTEYSIEDVKNVVEELNNEFENGEG